MDKQKETLLNIEQAMRKWIKEQIPAYEQMPAAQTMTTTQGERVLKANPAMQEIRANFRDYCYVVKTMMELGDDTEDIHSTLDEMKKKFKIVR